MHRAQMSISFKSMTARPPIPAPHTTSPPVLNRNTMSVCVLGPVSILMLFLRLLNWKCTETRPTCCWKDSSACL
ncbi:hypothetical protein AG1IA_10250 [Rhizoctonia solani AG-1 IA]|uniref:Uncharacterized protein n=1 Tax=Thanatephorus cucumeris (strain AG1-IA) TaxID=983506 RepID=L8WC17_THACA|nr:hypothetical protein AG1IA_10250 [Rhizoctonia solani AG-1 IA]